MTTVLQPGARAPDFALPASNSERRVRLGECQGRNIVLIFFPASFEEELCAQLTKFQVVASHLMEQGAIILGVSDAAEEELLRLAKERDVQFVLLRDSNPARATAAVYGVVESAGQRILPTVFILDGNGIVRRVYESAEYPSLPNPAMVERAVWKFAGTPTPPPVTPDDWSLGSSDAPAVLIEYSDYQCSPCGELHQVLEQVLPAYRDKVLLVHRHLPLRHSHPQAQIAAGAQGKFWEMHHRLFEARGELERDRLKGISSSPLRCLSMAFSSRDQGRPSRSVRR